MKWLQWSKSDLEFGLGGVEEHARCVARELRALGVDVEFSRDPAELNHSKWDVIQTHGSSYAPSKSRAVSVHTLHGTTLGRMAACGEWAWPGGYLAAARELHGVFRSDVTLSVHPGLSLYHLARSLSKVAEVCGNGWDAGTESESLPSDLLQKIDSSRPLWLYVGRGDDPVKGADRVRVVLDRKPVLQLIAVPGDGFTGRTDVLVTGRLSSAQVRTLLSLAQGLIIPSRYEGQSLVLLEALSEGLPVLATEVGGVPSYPTGIQGLVTREADADDLLSGIAEAESFGNSPSDRLARQVHNRALLPTWKSVAEIALRSVETFRAGRTRRS